MAARRLKTLDDLRRYLAAVVNRLDSGELSDAEAKSRAYVVNILASLVKDGDLELRLEALEKKAEEAHHVRQ